MTKSNLLFATFGDYMPDGGMEILLILNLFMKKFLELN
eukprot:CAMPEP_0117068122 /NCGR_PEP_ID=MMETSP0472-20121206/47726_1 /TAXON_ID=693140 ORGANISM="Tiarina fusus, Strain LIS" /NCGR_SAMPLE_ID=MMETSP0472 /ASSEMBLY_ACC=CAM_ASM_000603 /LENGTH=37 /DNA_ID= /DNA_START= /DNA_END= /DNA_ORIENTATION=